MMIDPVRLAAARQERRLARIHDDIRRVLQVQDGDVAVIEVQSRSTDDYGFEITGAHIRCGDQVVEVGVPLMVQLDNAVYDDLSSMSWKSLIGEDRFGHAVFEVPGTPEPGPVGTWIKVDVSLLRAWLSELDDPDDPRSTRAYENYDITPAWGTPAQIDGGYGETLTDIISDLPEEVLFSTLGAELAVDGLWDSDGRDPHLRVYVTLDAELRQCSAAQPARHLVASAASDAASDAAGERREIERVVETITKVVGIGNKLIDALMDRFG